jgi:hypothetical protein
MAYNAKKGLASGAAAGLQTGLMTGNPYAGLAAGAVGMLGGFEDETSQVPMQTPEQKLAIQNLLNFSMTGKWGNGFEAGAEVPLGYGDYNMTDLEGAGQSALGNLMRADLPDQYKMGDDALRDVLAVGPGALEGQFAPFKALAERGMRESADSLKRNAGFAGSLYNTDTIRRLGDVEARGNETMMAELARLHNATMDRKLAAIPLAYRSAESRDAAAMSRISAAHQYGALTRQLSDQKIKARDAELLRRRQELQLPIQAAQTVAGSSAEFGIPTVQTSPYQDLLNMVGQVGGQMYADKRADDRFNKLYPTERTGTVRGGQVVWD